MHFVCWTISKQKFQGEEKRIETEKNNYQTLCPSFFSKLIEVWNTQSGELRYFILSLSPWKGDQWLNWGTWEEVSNRCQQQEVICVRNLESIWSSIISHHCMFLRFDIFVKTSPWRRGDVMSCVLKNKTTSADRHKYFNWVQKKYIYVCVCKYEWYMLYILYIVSIIYTYTQYI